jgi:ribonuclease G
MQNEIVINATPGETRVALLERNQFVELHLERATLRSVVGNVVMGRVSRVLPGMQASFVDIGLEKAAFLYAGDYVEDIERLESGAEDVEDAPRGRRSRGRNGNARRSPPSIETVLEEGQEILVQIAKEPIGTKGARITSHVSIAGRHLVLTPWAQRVGVSRRIESDRERRRLRGLVDRLRPQDLGFIIRTAGEGTREEDLEADVRYLTSVWDDIQIRKDGVRAPSVLYTEPALPLRVIRDLATGDTKRIVVDSPPVHQEMMDFVSRFVADPKPRIELHRRDGPVFEAFGLEAQIEANLGRKVWLKSGGYLIIDQSEALTAIDVNTGRYVGRRDLEETVLRTNLEAVKEVVHQLRFRNIGGLIIIDLIDMESAENREKVYRALQEAIRYDKAKTNILKISELGLVEMTRKRTRENLVQTLCEPCPHCEGKGYVLSTESVAHKVLRDIQKDLPRFCGRHLAVTVHRQVAEILLGSARASVESLEQALGREIEVRARGDLHPEQFEVTALDEGPPVALTLDWLSEPPPAQQDRETEEAGEEAEPQEPTGAEAAPAEGSAEAAGAEPTAAKDEAATQAAVEEAQGPEDGVRAPLGAEAPLAVPEEPDEETEPSASAEAGPPVEAAAKVLADAPEAAGQPLDAEGEFPIIRRSEEREEP